MDENSVLAAGGVERIGLDRRYALEMVQAGEVSVEYDKIAKATFAPTP